MNDKTVLWEVADGGGLRGERPCGGHRQVAGTGRGSRDGGGIGVLRARVRQHRAHARRGVDAVRAGSGRQDARVPDGPPRRARPCAAGARVGPRELGASRRPADGRGGRAREQARQGTDALLCRLQAGAQPHGLRGPRRAARPRGRDPARARPDGRRPGGRRGVRREAGGGVHRLLTAGFILAGLGIAAAGGASADPVVTPIDEGVREQSCKALAASTVGQPEQFGVDQPASLPASWPAAPRGLPRRVFLRTATETFNRKYAFAVRGGEIYAQVPGQTWRRMPLPPCFDRRLKSISADDDEMIALDGAKRVFTMDNASKSGALFNWSSRWGTPFWLGPGYTLPDGVVAWAWSVVSPEEDGRYTDPAGNHQPIGGAKVSHIWALRSGGRRISFWDPWLPLDESYGICGPDRGRFTAVNLSASGSTIFVIGKRGDMFTRVYDFDLSGHDRFFDKYSYADQRGKGDNAPIQLPAFGWVHQPKIAGPITSAISIHKVGRDTIHRTLRVGGIGGYWEKDITQLRPGNWRS